MINSFINIWVKRIIFCLILLNITDLSFASTTSNLPFVTKTVALKDAIVGPFMLAIAMIMISVTSFALAFGEWSDGMRRLINIVFWLSIALAAPSFINVFFGTGAVF